MDNLPSKKDTFSGFTHPLSPFRRLLGISKFWPDHAKSKIGPTFENWTWEGGALPQYPHTNNQLSKKDSFSGFTHPKS